MLAKQLKLTTSAQALSSTSFKARVLRLSAPATNTGLYCYVGDLTNRVIRFKKETGSLTLYDVDIKDVYVRGSANNDKLAVLAY